MHAMQADDCLDPDTLAAYVDARLAADLRARADRHIDVCATCRREVSALVAVETRTVQIGPRRRPPTGEIPAMLGRYRVIRELGRGAMGFVLHAYDPELARPVALKVLHHAGPDTQRRLRGEAQAMA